MTETIVNKHVGSGVLRILTSSIAITRTFLNFAYMEDLTPASNFLISALLIGKLKALCAVTPLIKKAATPVGAEATKHGTSASTPGCE